MRRIETYIRRAVLWALAPMGMLAALSCQDDLVAERQPVQTGDEIAFALAKDSAWVALSRSAESDSPAVKETRRFLTVIGKDSVFLHTRVEDNTPPVFSDAAESRAASQTTAGLSSFYLTAYYNGSEFMKNQLVEKKNGNWEYTPVKYWPNNEGAEVHFYGYTSAGGVTPTYTLVDGAYQGTFSNYTLPAPNDAKKDAEQQPDLIFAMAPAQTKQSITGKVQLKFYHALSAICFKIGEMPEGTTMQSISIAEVMPGGSCVMTSADANGGINFAWTPSGEATTYTQIFNKADVKKDDVITEDATTFMMIPQEFEEGGNAHLVIRFRIGEKDYEFEHPLIITDEDGKVTSDEWEANKKYTYTLSTVEVVEVDVTDQVTGDKNTVKEQVKIQNTGLAKAYIRAAIVGYWVNENGDIVASWNATDKVGEFTGLQNENWLVGNDGFYYHKAVVGIGNYTQPLFERYELKENPPIVGASLELNIVVQAVKDSDVTSAWTGVTVSNGVLTSN